MLLCVGGGCTSLPPVQPPGRPAPLSGRHDPRGGGLLASEPRGFVKWLEARPPKQLKLSRNGSSWAATAQVEPQQLKLSCSSSSWAAVAKVKLKSAGSAQVRLSREL